MFPRSAAAVVGLYSAGIYDGKEIERGLKYLMRFLPDGRGRRRAATRGRRCTTSTATTTRRWRCGRPAATTGRSGSRRSATTCSPGPGPAAGGWNDYAYGAAYATAMACIILQLPNNYLPILQK